MDANVNAEDLRRLGRDIKRGTDEIEKSLRSMEAALRRTPGTDSKRKQFEGDFQDVLHHVKRFQKHVIRFQPELERMARAIDDYKQR